MIKRVWHGWASPANADAYESLLREEVFPGIAAKSGAGFRGAELLRLAGGGEVEFMTIICFDSPDAIRQLAGEDATLAYVPDKARALLSRWDERARHFELRVEEKA